jgi:hypothetical protein
VAESVLGAFTGAAAQFVGRDLADAIPFSERMTGFIHGANHLIHRIERPFLKMAENRRGEGGTIYPESSKSQHLRPDHARRAERMRAGTPRPPRGPGGVRRPRNYEIRRTAAKAAKKGG